LTRLLANPTLRLFIGAALISLSPVWVKLVQVSTTTSAFWRLAIGGVVIAAYLVVTFYHRSIDFVGPGLATLLANFQVFVMAAAGFLVLGQRPTALQLISVPLAFAGLALIVGVDWGELPEEYRRGIVFGLAAAVTYAAYLLAMRSSRHAATTRVPSREMAIVSLFGAAMLGATAFGEGVSLAIPRGVDLAWLACYGVLSHGLGMLFITSSLPHVTTTQAGLALLLQPTLSFVWDVAFFARPMRPSEFAGAALALFAIYLGSRSKQAQRARQ
jgi:drug/metabolite transporter (DMT)-like permease